MTSALRCLTILTVGLVLTLPAAAQEAKAVPAVYSHAAGAPPAQLASWPGYYYYGVYYGSYRWRYQPYYTYYASPWVDYGVYYAPYSYAGPAPYAYSWPAYGYGYYYAPYYGASGLTWPHYAAYGYTYFGPVIY